MKTTRAHRTKKTTLGTGLSFEVHKPEGYPRGARAYVLRAGRDTYAVRPEPMNHGAGEWRVDLLGWVAEAPDGLGGYFDTPEQAAWALEAFLARGARKPRRDEHLALLGTALADAARAACGGGLLYKVQIGGTPVVLRAVA